MESVGIQYHGYKVMRAPVTFTGKLIPNNRYFIMFLVLKHIFVYKMTAAKTNVYTINEDNDGIIQCPPHVKHS